MSIINTEFDSFLLGIHITLLPQCTETYRYFGATSESVADGGVVICGSMGEVSNDPSFTEVFDVLSNGFTVSSEDTMHNQKSVIWTEVALYGDDQLRQRMAWAVSIFIEFIPILLPGPHRHEMLSLTCASSIFLFLSWLKSSPQCQKTLTPTRIPRFTHITMTYL